MRPGLMRARLERAGLRLGEDRGGATAELGLLLPLLLLMAAAAWPLLGSLGTYAHVQDAVQDGVRFATKVERNPAVNSCSLDLGLSGSRRQSNSDVVAFVEEAVRYQGAVATVTVDHPSGSLCSAAAGSAVTVTVTYPVTTGLLADMANGLSTFLDGDPIFEDGVRAATAHGRLE